MKILTLWQPWAGAVGIVKFWETRPKPTKYRGPLAIHAGLGKSENQAAGLWREILEKIPGVVSLAPPDAIFHRGTIIRTAKLVECVRTEDVVRDLSATERAFGNFSPGRYAYRLTDVVPIVPVPWKGAQGFRDVPRAVYSLFKIGQSER